jgi:2-keto-4-pentenoate hydratase/2-oxohepta-3-ene-1,7-dioic acid hydratase in catechol pathway
MRLEPGDMILTGTPSGVGPIKVGDTIEAGLGHDFLRMHFKVVPKPKVLKK